MIALESGLPLAAIGKPMLSANAYLGAEGMVEALETGADVVITGRVADPSLVLAPLIHAFGWADDDWERLGAGTLAGHLLECGFQITGGYFADPGRKDVPGLAYLGYPLAEVEVDGSMVITKLPETGGCVTPLTVKEQLLYEVHDPAAYLQPDVTADFSGVTFHQEGPDRVRAVGAAGSARPETLKVTIGYRDGFIGEGQISYAGSGAVARARLAMQIAVERLKIVGVTPSELRADVIGVDSLLQGVGGGPQDDVYNDVRDVRARIVGRTASLRDAERIGREIEAIWLNGPAGGGGATWGAREVIAAASALLPRDRVRARFVMETA
jgi:hypothetical protein